LLSASSNDDIVSGAVDRSCPAHLSNDLQVADLPAALNEALHALLGITTPEDALGVLQDIHWHEGLFGYFPSYTLRAMAAAQLMLAALRQINGLDAALCQGDFALLLGRFRKNVHEKGSLFGFNDLMR